MKGLNDHKKKFYVYILLLSVVLILSWKLAIKETFISYQKLHDQRKSRVEYPNPDKVIDSLNQLLNLASQIPKIQPEIVDEYLFEFISENISPLNIELEEFPKSNLFQSENFQLITYQLSFSGSFKNLLKFEDKLSLDLGFGEIKSLKYTLEQKRNQRDKLIMELVFQVNYKNQ